MQDLCKIVLLSRMHKIVIYSHRISLSRRQTDGDMGSAEKILLSGRRATDRCELSPREEGWVDPRVLSCLYLLKMI